MQIWRKSNATQFQGSADNLRSALDFPRQRSFTSSTESMATMKTMKNCSSTWHRSGWWRREISHASGLDARSTFVHCQISVSPVESDFCGHFNWRINDRCERSDLPAQWSGAIEESFMASSFHQNRFFGALNWLFSSLAKQMLIPLRLRCFPPDRLSSDLIAWLSRSFRAIEDGGAEKSFSEASELDFEFEFIICAGRSWTRWPGGGVRWPVPSPSHHSCVTS